MTVWVLLSCDPESANIHGIYATRELALAAFKAVPFPPKKTPIYDFHPDRRIRDDHGVVETDHWEIPHGHELFSEEEPAMGWEWDSAWWAKIEEWPVQV